MMLRSRPDSRRFAVSARGAVLAALLVFPIVLSEAAAPGSEEPARSTGSWSPDGLGNHRARLRVARGGDAVLASIPWRRHDAAPERIDAIVVDAASGKRVANVLRVRVTRERGDLLFQPPTVPGDYHVYFLPFRTEGWWAFPRTVYLPASETADPAWAASVAPVASRVAAGETGVVPLAELVDIQALRDFDRFDPMEVVATEEETRVVVERHRGEPFLVFPEDRRYPIRRTRELPLRWARSGPALSHRGEARPGELFAFQLGVHAAYGRLEDLRVASEGLVARRSGRTLELRCYNSGGVDWLGRRFSKALDVPVGSIQPLWLGVQVPADAEPDTYRGTVRLSARGRSPVDVAVDIAVSGPEIADAGDGEIWRHSRLRWLDSTIGLDDEPVGPYPGVDVGDDGRSFRVLGREVRIGAGGLPEGIRSAFRRNVDGTDAPPREILAAAARLVAEAEGRSLPCEPGPSVVTERKAGAVAWESTSRAGPLEVVCRGRLELDGHMAFDLTVRAAAAARLDDLALEVPLRRDAAVYMMGLGRKGGLRPREWRWTWDVSRANGQVWLGDVNAGLALKLRHVEDRWDLYNMAAPGIYRDWGNDGKGGCTVSEEGETVLVRVFTGPREMAAGEELRLRFALLPTPLKPLDPRHWSWRYFHQGSGAPVADVAATGAKIINLHQGDGLNPHINYPFLSTDRLSAYVRDAHSLGLQVKLYYTVRELSNHAVEIWALRSLGNEVFLDGPGFRIADQFEPGKAAAAGAQGGGSWLCEHLVDRYVPAWHTPLPDGDTDAAIATTGLSRWHNYYLEGLAWLVRTVEIDGLYLDGIGYDREIMKRVRKVLDRTRPGCLIDFHSGNNFHPEYGLNSCAVQYLEHLPWIDSLWFGEGFDYGESPDYWLVEVSGIPFGLFGEMLQGGGNPWRGMVFGMTSRLGWGGDPRPVWEVQDSFGIREARMVGWWDAASPVRTGRDDVLATAYLREGKALIALASWAPEPVRCRISVDGAAFGLPSAPGPALWAPRVRGFQPEALFRPGDEIPVAPGRGWLLVADGAERAIAPAADLLAGRKAILEERFEAEGLPDGWTPRVSSRPGTAVRAAGGRLSIEAVANAAAFVERPLPPGVAAVACSVDAGTDGGASWGPGISLGWADGKVLRVNLRAEGRFGADDGARQALEGVLFPGAACRLAILLDEKEISLRASCGGDPWQEIAAFPRAEFPGDPILVRVGKMSPGSRCEDFSEPGPPGACSVDDLRALGPTPLEASR